MKKILFVLLLMVFSCLETVSAAQTRVLVSYFSYTGTTKALATTVGRLLKADVYEITPVQKYKPGDICYDGAHCRSIDEQHDPAARPAIKEPLPKLEKYDVIFVAYPIWLGVAPRIVDTFMENGNFEGKMVVLMCTSGKSTIDASYERITELLKPQNNVRIYKGSRFERNVSEPELSTWLKSLGL